MNKYLYIGILFIFNFVLLYSSAFGQDTQKNHDQLINYLSETTNVSKDSLIKEFSGILNDILNNTETLNKVLDTYVIDKSGIDILKDFNLKFKTFYVNNDDNSTALGVSYSYSKDIQKQLFSKQTMSNSGVSFALKMEGNVAFDQDINPEDFLNTKLAFHFFHSKGGVTDLTDTSIAIKLNKLDDALVEITNQDALDNSPLWKEFLLTVSNRLTTQFYLDFSLNAGIESNQNFTKKQYVYGAQLGIDLKAWNRYSSLANLNIFDWPFAVIRVLTGYDKELSPRGSVIPTILVGIDQVNPEKDSLRFMIEDNSNYPRFRSEISFKTPISTSAYFLANFRYYKELDASSPVKVAKIDEFSYFTSAITLSNGMFVSYSTGKLPFDFKNDQIYEIGFQYQFN